VCCLKLALISAMTEPPRKGVHCQDQLERFSVKRKHNQHTSVQYHIIHSSRSYYNLGSRISYTKEVSIQNYASKDITEFAEAISLTVRTFPFALKGNVIHRHYKPGDPSTESNPHRFGLSTDNPRRHRREEEAVPHLHTDDSKSKACATTLSKTYPR
jgi:hypothetical protein